MGVKKIQVSDDSGSTWYTLPGNTGDLASQGASIDDTIFGQNYKSSQVGLINWTLSANGLYKGFAGYVATLKILGTPTGMMGEAMAQVGTSQVWAISDATKSALDLATALTFKDTGSAIAASNIVSVDYLFGRVTFAEGYTPSGAVTVDGDYLPSTVIARASGFTLTQSAATIDDTDFATAQANGGYMAYKQGLSTVSLALTGIMSTTNDWRTQLGSRATVLVEINPDGAGKSVARGYFQFTDVGQSGNVGAQEATTATLPLSVPQSDILAYPFAWKHSSDTTLNLSIQKLLNAYTAQTSIEFKYLWDGTNGWTGTAFLTDMSLAGGLGVMNDFTVKAQGTGEMTAVP